MDASDKPDDEAQAHEDDRRDDYALTPNEKKAVALSPLQRLDSAIPDRLKQCFEIALVLVCIGQRKFGDSFIKARVRSKVTANHRSIARLRVSTQVPMRSKHTGDFHRQIAQSEH